MLLWGRGMGKMPIPPTFYSLTFYSFTFKDMFLWGHGMGKMPIPPTFYSFTLLPLKICFCGGVVWARCPYLLLFTLLLFYSFTFSK